MIYLPNYASALRCIGQALEGRNVEVFELTTEGDQFIAKCGDTNPPYTGIVEIRFSRERIEILDREGQARRRQTAKAEFRFDSLSQILRAAGKYLDNKRAELRRLNNYSTESGDVEIEYRIRAGKAQSETLPMRFIRQTAVEMYKGRSHISNPIDMVTRRKK